LRSQIYIWAHRTSSKATRLFLTKKKASSINESRHCAAVFFLRVAEECTDIDLTLFYILILKIKQIRMEIWNASTRRLFLAAWLERWPQVCRVKIAFELISNKNNFSYNKFQPAFERYPTILWAKDFEKQNQHRFWAWMISTNYQVWDSNRRTMIRDSLLGSIWLR